MPMAGPSFGGSMPAMERWSPMGMMMPSGAMHMQSGGPMQERGQGRGTSKRKHSCDKCGAMDHWK
jgi:hypothetical protein